MQINVKQFLAEAGITEAFYPGKRLVHPLRHTGEYKSHCVVLDWRDPAKIKIEVKAGLSGKDLEPKVLKYYPVCFQAPTYVDIEVMNDNAKAKDDDEEEEETAKGKGGSGGKSPKKSKLNDAVSAFGSAIEGVIPELGTIVEMVVMGKEMLKENYAAVMHQMAKQLQHAHISATELLAKASSIVTKFTPPSFLEPKGDEQVEYKYDREKNADIGFRRSLT